MFRNYFPFSWSLQTIHNRPCGLAKRIPNWKSIRRMEVELTGRLHCVASLNHECLGFGMMIVPPIRIRGIAKTRKYFTIYKSLFNSNNPCILRSSTAASTNITIHNFPTLKLLECNYFILRCAIRLSSAAPRELSTNEKLRKKERKLFKLMLK